MLNLSFDGEKKRQLVLENFNNPIYKVSLIKLQKFSISLGVDFHTFSSLNSGCGDTIHLLIQRKDNLIEWARFASKQQACCLTIAATNVLCCWMENKNIELVKTEISQVEKMLQGKVYQLNSCSQMEIFQDLPNFPHRVECVGLVLRGIKKILSKKTKNP